MDTFDIAFVKGIIVFALAAGTGMSAFWLWLRERRRGGPELNRIVDALREENAALHADLGTRIFELEDRVDFVERRVVEAPRVESLPSRITTPV